MIKRIASTLLLLVLWSGSALAAGTTGGQVTSSGGGGPVTCGSTSCTTLSPTADDTSTLGDATHRWIDIWGGTFHGSIDSIGVAGTSGVILINNTAATNILDQYSPVLTLRGHAWFSGGSVVSEAAFQMVGTEGGGSSAVSLRVSTRAGGSGSWTKNIEVHPDIVEFYSDLCLTDGTAGTCSYSVSAQSGSVASGITSISAPVDASGSPLRAFSVVGGAHTGMTAVQYSDVVIDLSQTKQFTAGSTIASQPAIWFKPPTYTATAAQTITDAALLRLEGAPTCGSNVTCTNDWALLIAGGQSQFPAGSASLPAVTMATSGKTSGLYGFASNKLGWAVNAAAAMDLGTTGLHVNQGLTVDGTATIATILNVNVAPTAATGTPAADIIDTPPSHTSLTQATEIHARDYKGATWQWTGGGTFTTERFTRFEQPTFSATSATTITNGYNVYVDDAPAQGTNMTITNKWAAGFGNAVYVTTPGSSAAALVPLVVDKAASAANGDYVQSWRRSGTEKIGLFLDASDNAIFQGPVGIRLWSPNNTVSTGTNAGYFKIDDVSGVTAGYTATTFLQLTGSAATLSFGSGVGQVSINANGTIIGNGSGVKIGFFDKSPVVRDATTFTLNSGSLAHDLPSGATTAQVEQVLRQLIKDLGNTAGMGLVKADL